MTFEYVEQVDFKFPQSIIDAVMAIEPSKFVFNTISKQINNQLNLKVDPSNLPSFYSGITGTIDLDPALYMQFWKEREKIMNDFGIQKMPEYSKDEIAHDLSNKIVKCLPEVLLQFDPVPVFQRTFGQGLLPHTDHNRHSSLFYLLTEPDDIVTAWYDPALGIDLFQEIRKHGFLWPLVDVKQLILRKSIVLQKNVCYVFDNRTFHSVKGSSPVERKTLQIEFKNTSPDIIYEALKG
jgi:hypothetical protein